MKSKLLTRLAALVGGVGLLTQAAGAQTNFVGGYITGNETWYATNTYILTNFVYVLSNATLTVEAGTLVKGRNGSYALDGDGVPRGFGCLVINRGAKLFAEGTACDPIIFTAEQDDVNDPFDMPINGAGSRAQWGGVVINGRAPINAANRLNLTPVQDVYEGLPDAVAPASVGGEPLFRFGGTDGDDNSGVIRYVSIRHGGKQIESNKEINGLSLGGVGRGTTIEHVESYLIADDGFEFFGGTVNTKYLVSAFCDDDSFDTDQGYSGTNQFWFSIQAQDARDEGGELNGMPNELDANGTFPFESTFQVYNWTAVGAGVGSGSGNEALVIRQRSQAQIRNSVFTEFDGRKLVLGTNAAPVLENNLFWACLVGDGSLGSTPNTSLALNPEANPMLIGINRDNVAQLIPVPVDLNSPVYSAPASVPGGYLTPAAYKGAFSESNWMLKWTALDNNGYLGWQIPPPTAVMVVVPNAVTLAITPNGAKVDISFTSQTGFTYTLESTGVLSPAGWIPADGATPSNPQAGTGGTLTFTVPAADATKFFQVQAQ